ncbi:MAG: DivIVA domain-containing protein [Oscillospiraceae bacterium]|nr:DivIVA domain-containing protein [Oscillospiraceae bacterium]
MLTAEEIREVTFDKSVRGYRVEDVHAFLEEVAVQMEALAAEKEELEKKVYVLAEKVSEYRKDEDNLKTALINAQRLGEQVIQEARQKGEKLLRDAGQKAERLEEEAKNRVEDERLNLARIQAEVAQFKGNVLSLYKQHIDSLSTLPDAEEEKAAPPSIQEAETDAVPQPSAAEEIDDSIFENLQS